MLTLRECLTSLSIRHLWAIGQVHTLNPPQRHPPKQVWIETLHRFLADADNLRRLIVQLSDAEHDALQALLALPHPVLAHAFCARHGEIRPYRPWDRSTPSPDRPWHFPISSAEHLWYLGLLFPAPPDRPGGQPRLTLAAEHRHILTPFFLATAAPHATSPLPSSPPALHHTLYDLIILLALLHQRDVVLAHNRWLPPAFLRLVNQHISHPADLTAVRSELQAPRLHFLHYLAHTLGLLTLVAGRLEPAPTLPLWLQAEPAVRIHRLWRASFDAAPWRTFQLPGADTPDPTAFAQHLLHLLSQAPTGAWRSIPQLLAELTRSVHPQPVWWQAPDFQQRLPHLIAALALGPLFWLGCVETCTETHLQLRATDLARAWFGAAVLTPLPAPQPFTLQLAPEQITLCPPNAQATPNLAQTDLARLFDLVSQFGSLTITPERLAQVLAQETPLDAILNLLSRACNRPLTTAEYDTLANWASVPAPIAIHRFTVLETADPAQLTALSARRAVRPLLGRTLNRRMVIVPESRLPLLIGRLRRLRIPVRLTIPASAITSAQARKRTLDDSGYLYLAGLVFQQLSRFDNLPVRLPSTLLDQLAARLPPETASDLHALADELLARLQTAFDGYSGPPHDNPHPANQDDIQTRLAAAVANEQSVEITYWTAWRGELTHRRVDPYRLETRSASVYLIAYCHLRRAERVFRLDRILAVADIQPPAAPLPAQPAPYDPAADDIIVPF